MTMPVTLFGLRTDEQQAAVLVQVALFDEVADYGGRPTAEGTDATPPLLPQVLADLVFLQAQGQQLLGD